MTQRSYSMADAYRSIYEEDTSDTIQDALDFLVESGIIDEEELELLEMRKQDKVAGVKPGGNPDPAMRAVLKMKGQLQSPQQKKKVPGEKKPRNRLKDGPTPAQRVASKRAAAKRVQDTDTMHSRFD